MIKVFAKFIFAFAILGWLFKSGKLDFGLIQESFQNGYNWLFCFLLIIFQAVGSSFRWRILLKIKSKKNIPLIEAIKLTWIGLFFSSVLPGAITGDIVKVVYARELDPKLTKTFLITTALMDRILGLMGLIFLLGISSLYFYADLVQFSSQMGRLIFINLFLLFGSFVFLGTLFLPQTVQDFFLNSSAKIPKIGKRIKGTLEQIWEIGKNRRPIIVCLLISIILHCSNISAFWIITSSFFGKALSIKYAFSFVPLGLIAIAIPISPAGMGVGHLIFGTLFSYVGIKNGASLFNLFFLVVVFTNSLGAIPYILKRKAPLAKTEKT